MVDVSKELLSEVLELDVTRICILENNYLYYKIEDLLVSGKEDNSTLSVNIDELAAMCREWMSYQTNYSISYDSGSVYIYFPKTGKDFEGEEVEAVLEATQWVLNSKEVKT